jgi:outer membrane receptor for ferrienterochelin and colicins
MKIKFILLFICSLIASALHAQNDSAANVDRLLDLSLEQLMNIKVITASGFDQKLSEAPSTMNVITARQIQQRGYEQLEDALRDIPGIDLIHLNGYVPTLIYFRGMYGAENLRALLMIDGVPENNIIGSNDMAGPAYNLHNVERIEIIWGPASALYGANAFGGVINIITKKGADINGLQFEKGYGSFNTSLDKIMFGINKSKFDIAISGSLYSTDGPKFTNRDPNYTASYVNKAYSFTGTISYTGKQSKTTLGTRIYDTPMGWGTFFNSPTQLLGLPSQGNGNTGVIGLIARDVRGEKSGLEEPYARTVFIQNELMPIEKLNILTRVTYRETGISDNSYAYLTVDGRKLYRIPTTNYSNRVEGEIIANYSLDANQQFSAGVQVFRDNVERGNRMINIDTSTIYFLDGRDTLLNLYSTFKQRQYDIRHNFGSYVQYALNTTFLTKTNFTIGARYDYNNYYGSPLSPRLAIVNQPNDKFTIKLLFGTAFRAPTNTEIYQAPPNFKLKTEKIKTYEVNLINQASAKTLLQLNGFRNDLTDVIILGNLVNLVPDKNPGRITINGLEAMLNSTFTSHFSGFVNFTYQDAIGRNLVTNLVRSVPGIAKVKGNLGISLHVADLFNVNIIGNWVGTRTSPKTDPYGAVSGYFLTNFVLTTDRLFDKRVYASVNIRNVFNVKWLDPGFRTADGSLYSTVLEQPGINGLFKIGVHL